LAKSKLEIADIFRTHDPVRRFLRGLMQPRNLCAFLD
jgi:hypothetical protein